MKWLRAVWAWWDGVVEWLDDWDDSDLVLCPSGECDVCDGIRREGL